MNFRVQRLQFCTRVVDFELPIDAALLFVTVACPSCGFLGKFLAGFCAWGKLRRAFIGAGMVPRGEVGLIFASMGLQTGAMPQSIFVAVLLAVFLTTFVTPPLLKRLAPRPS